MKKIFVLSISLLFFWSLVACGNVNEEPSTLNSDKSGIGNLLNETSTVKGESDADENELHLSGKYPEYLRGWNDGKNDDEVIYDYSGGEIVVPHHIQNGSFESVIGLCVMLDGVMQDFYITDDETGERSETTSILELKLEKDIDKCFQIHFTPNMGEKGNILELSVGTFWDFDAFLTEENEFAYYGNSHDYRDVKCRRVKMLTDSALEIIAKDIDATICEADKRVTDVYVNLFEEDVVEGFVYTDFEESECGMANIIKAKVSEPNTYNIDIVASTGKYRVSFYIDHQLQKDINGTEYFDIETVSGKINNFEITLPENELLGWHHMYIMIREVNNEYDYSKTTTKIGTKILSFE